MAFFKIGSLQLSVWLVWNHDPPDLCLLSSEDYSHQHLARVYISRALRASYSKESLKMHSLQNQKSGNAGGVAQWWNTGLVYKRPRVQFSTPK
jgi:hypothetical protein